MCKTFLITILLFLTVTVQSCFTGVESTPKITAGDVKKQKVTASAEQLYLASAKGAPPSQWTAGKKFYVTDNKISLIFTPSSTGCDSLAGKYIAYAGFSPIVSITGDEMCELHFTAPEGGAMHYRVPYSSTELAKRESLEVPFTIERSVVDSVVARLEGRTMYITTPYWYDPATEKAVANNLRHIPVHIVKVSPGNQVYPIKVEFTYSDPADAANEQRSACVFINVGQRRSATKGFATQFAFDNPRLKYPNISDEMWRLITHSNVADGMTRDECRLALGAPNDIVRRDTNAGQYEKWEYDDGVFLIFLDDILTQFRK